MKYMEEVATKNKTLYSYSNTALVIKTNILKLKQPFLILLFLMSNQLLAQQVDLSKKINFEAKDQTIESIIQQIEARIGLAFSYSKKSINAGRKITLSANNQPISTLLTQLSEIANIEYVLVEKQIVLKPLRRKKSDKTPAILKHTLSGFIKDKSTGETLIGATIYIKDSGQGTVTNEYGFFSLTMPKGNYNIEFSHVGYTRQRTALHLEKELRVSMELEVSQITLPKIILSVKEHLPILESNFTGQIKLNPSDLKNIPEFGGEVGLIKSLQTLPGIKTHSDGSAYFFVRGGAKDQNFVLIDDAPVYNHAHLFGFFSIFVPEFTKDITVYKSDIPVSQGDRLSSLIDIRTKDGNLNKWGMTGIFNPLVSTIAFEGPLKKEKASIFASFRRSNFDWVYKREAPNVNIYFTDFNFKFNTKLNKNNRLYLTLFNGEDVIQNFNTSLGARGGISWKNSTFTTRWNHIFNDKLFLNTIIYGSGYQYYFRNNDILWTSSITNASIKLDFAYYKNPDLTFRFGFNQNIHAFNPGNISTKNETTFLPEIPRNQSRQKALYLNTEHNLTEKFSYNIGLRAPLWANYGPTTSYRYDERYQVIDTLVFGGNEDYESFITIDPRVSLKYALTEKATVKASYGRYHQFMQMLSNSTAPFTSLDVWLPSSSTIKPQEAHQFTLGYYRSMEKNHLEFTAEAYYKIMKNQIDYKPHANMLLNPLVEGELRFGKAWSYGLELFLKKTKGRLTGWAGYTFSRTFKQTNGVNNDKKYPAFYDRPHDFSVFLSYQVSKRTNISANWIYYTGSAISTPIGFYEYNNQTVPLYGDKNNDRFPDYHRLDLALSFKLNKRKSKFNHELNLSIYNVYFQKNPISLNFNKVKSPSGQFVVPTDVYNTQDIVPTQTILVQFMPSLTYKFKL